MDDSYLIPANANRGKLIFGFFRLVDLGVFALGIFCSLIIFFMFQEEMSNTWIAVLTFLPAAIGIFLVLPVPNQHNILVLLQEIYRFYFVNRQRYVWRGWCGQYGESNRKK